jgi:hypothetical protein
VPSIGSSPRGKRDQEPFSLEELQHEDITKRSLGLRELEALYLRVHPGG